MSDAHQSPLISLPLKTTEEVDLGSAVKSLITNSYGEDAKSYAEQTSQLNRARQDAVRGAGSDATGRDLLFKWFHMLEMLELRFPELRVPFPWKDAFTSKQISQSSLAYEKASIIFNIAATLSSLASAQPRMSGNPDGVKRAYTALRQSAGMLSYINENFLHAPSTDMSKDVVKFLVGLVLAQASEVFLEKTIEEKKGNGLISKLASQTAAAYTGLVEDAREFAGKAIFERSWSTLIQTKAKYFTSIMHYYRALADDATGSHGACLVRLTVAETQAKEAQRIVVSFSASAATSSGSERSLPSLPSDAGSAMTALVSAHVARCTERKDVAVKDNDLIYHDILPSESTLPAVDKLVAATPIAIQEIFAAPEVQRVIGPDLFQNLVPLGVHEKASLYSEEKAKIARAESERHDLANGELQASLEYLNLPASLKKYRAIAQGGGGNGSSMLDSLADPGSEVMRWSDEEAEGGGGRGADGLGTGTAGVTSALSRIDSIKSQATAEIESASAALDDENRECEKQRVRFGHKWSQDPAGLHTKEMRQNLKDNREALQQASQNDAQINELWSSIRDDIQLLVSGREALEAAFAAALTGQTGLYGGNAAQTSLIDVSAEEESASAADVAAVKAKVSQIDELLIKLNKIKKERGEVLSDLKEKIQTDDISQVLVLNRRSQNVDASIFNAELEKFKPHQNRIAVSLHHQQALLSELNNAVQELRELPAAKAGGSKWDEKERARNQLVQRLKRARESNAQVRAGVAKGVQFYTDLLEIVKATRQSVNSYCADRKAQRQKLVSELEWDERGSDGAGSAARMGIRGGGAGGPPPPPPPHATTQRQASYGSVYSGTAGPTSAPYSSGGPPLPPSVPSSASVSSPYDSMFSTGPFADNRASQSPSSTHHPSYAAPGYPSHHATSPPPLPPHQQPQPQGQRQASGGVGLPPPPQQFHSSFSPSPAQQPASSPTAQSYQPPPPPLPQQQQQYSHQQSPYSHPPPPAQYQHQQQHQYSQPPQSPYHSQPPATQGYAPPPPPPQHQPYPQQHQQYASPAPAPQQQHSYQAYRPPY
ncbi:BRO1-domain-containing protein [Testicularia cyperi]|uniref:BRO domain-containing protein 1 n=1 Tax=Testicularia cyperi TaxID=1882483 RepID=A0A317XXG5_9BASI|nr:BRO1-domain-containing protein [Testicularia cyperi]